MAVKYWQGGWFEPAVVGSDDEKAGQTVRCTDFGRTWRQFLARPVKSPMNMSHFRRTYADLEWDVHYH